MGGLVGWLLGGSVGVVGGSGSVGGGFVGGGSVGGGLVGSGSWTRTGPRTGLPPEGCLTGSAAAGRAVLTRAAVSPPAAGMGAVVEVEDVLVVVVGRGWLVVVSRALVVGTNDSRAATVWSSSGAPLKGPPAMMMPISAPAPRMRAATHRWFKTDRV